MSYRIESDYYGNYYYVYRTVENVKNYLYHGVQYSTIDSLIICYIILRFFNLDVVMMYMRGHSDDQQLKTCAVKETKEKKEMHQAGLSGGMLLFLCLFCFS